MNSKDYQIATRRTDIEDYASVAERIAQNSKALKPTIDGFLLSSSGMDLMKKKVMYNADPLKLVELDAKLGKQLFQFPNNFVEKTAETELGSKLFHYSLGVITESNELVLALSNYTSTGKIDVVNFKEEVGDILFYLCRICDVLGFDMEDAMEKNINKLKVRYPEKFEEHSAMVRDLISERDILE